jgi:hypothetical protein
MKAQIKILCVVLLVLPLLLLGVDCKKKPPVAPPDDSTTVDTISHNFTFTAYTFGGNAGSSGFKDVAIINDTDIWAVGGVYVADSSVNGYTMYNAVHWDGIKWRFEEIQFYTFCGQSHSAAYAINSVFTFSQNDIWFCDSGEMIHWNGTGYEHYCSISSQINGALNKIWGVTSSNLYIVGNGGTILHYDGSTWAKQESGTDIDLRDVWGTPDGKTVWACGRSIDMTKSVLLKYNGQSWQTIWNRDTIFTSPYGYFVTSVWGIESLIAATGRGVFQDTTQVVTLPWFPYRIRGSAKNNIAVAGDNGMIWHWSGENWKELNNHSGQPLYSVAVSPNKIVAVGSDFTVGLGAALIYLGQRK